MYFITIKLIFTLGILVLPVFAQAHPVSFRDSIGIMGYHSPNLFHNQLNYSWRHWVSTGVHHIRRPTLDTKNTANLASVNLLLKRWNGDAYQGNLYAALGGGQSDFDEEVSPVGFGLLQFDIEDRKYYFLSKHSRVSQADKVHLEQSLVRGGIAPYVAEYGSIHSWLILEWSNTRFLNERWIAEVTPFLRVFHKNILFEIGQSTKGMTKFNYITHF